LEENKVNGSCLCGAIVFEAEIIPEKIFNCHCSQCRKSHGAAFATQAFAKGETLKFLKGEELISEYSGHGGVRVFCSKCGSRLMNYTPDKQYLSLALSNIDSEFHGKPVAHAFVGSKANWHEPSTDIPSFKRIPRNALAEETR